MKKILFASAECEPFIKTGGLGNVVGSLSRALNREEFDTAVILPRYACIQDCWKDAMTKGITFSVSFGADCKPATVYSMSYEGIPYYFIENEELFGGETPYSDMGADIEKFAFFSRAVLELFSYEDAMKESGEIGKLENWIPDIIHCHDWQVGLIPAMLKTIYGENPFYSGIRTIMTIHNLRFQGWTSIDWLRFLTHLPDQAFAYDKLECQGQANLLKGGLAYADLITTVSETYAEEIQTKEYGEGLEGLIAYRKDQLIGIVNGLDYSIYSPADDPYLTTHYTIESCHLGKAMNKKELQKKTGLPQDEDAFVIGLVARLTEQKGLDLFTEENMESFCTENIQLIILGDGESRYENLFRRLEEKYPDQVRFCCPYTDQLAKSIYAGSDASLMPSLFEPCGLSQMMAFRYGSIPIVRRTGGLKDTVEDYQEETGCGTGFCFTAYESDAFFATMRRAYHVYKNKPEAWKMLTYRAMDQDFSWEKSAKRYEELYR